MSTTTNINGTDETTRGRGFGSLPCPCCGERAATIRIDLDDLRTMTCLECDGEFTTDDVRSFIASWSRVLDRLDAI